MIKSSAVLSLVSEYERYRNSTINLIPSENVLSEDVLRVLASRMAGRYAGKPETYGGSSTFHDIWDLCENLARKVFRARFASAVPISGHLAGMAAIDSLTRKGDSIATISAAHGGYKGYNRGFVPDLFHLKVNYLPFDEASWNVNTSRAIDQLKEQRTSLVILGATVFLFPHPLREIAEAVHSYGGRVIYDASHVFGLIAGKRFQDPLREGADVVVGSTHKTLFGPQGGLILSNDNEIAKSIESSLLYRFVDNFHLNRVAALAVALEEVITHGIAYANQVIENSKTLARALFEFGIPVLAREFGFTESHQVFLNYGNQGALIRDKLESNWIISDSRVRLGTNEVTRRGMRPMQMDEIALLVRDTLASPNNARIRQRVRSLAKAHERIKYTLSK